jgi:hypothetical protein
MAFLVAATDFGCGTDQIVDAPRHYVPASGNQQGRIGSGSVLLNLPSCSAFCENEGTGVWPVPLAL